MANKELKKELMDIKDGINMDEIDHHISNLLYHVDNTLTDYELTSENLRGSIFKNENIYIQLLKGMKKHLYGLNRMIDFLKTI